MDCNEKRIDLRWVAVQPDTHSFQFSLQQPSLFRLLGSIENHADQVTRLCCTNDLSSSSLALSRTLDDTGQIEDLDLSTTILEHTRDGR
jgi:hypothetical protein